MQLDFAWGELNGAYKKHFEDFKKSTTIEDATYIIVRHYEVAITGSGTRPNDVQHYDKRLAYAKQWLSKSGGVSSAPSAESTGQTISGCSASGGACSIAYEDQYSQAQLASLFGDPGTENSHPEIESKLKQVKFNGRTVKIHSLAAGCLTDVAKEISSKNINYKIKEMGCYRYDSDNGSSNIGKRSYHTYGVACDINWTTNPWSGDGSPKPYDMPDEYVEIFKKHGFTWGGEWTSVKDYMHFEYHGIKP